MYRRLVLLDYPMTNNTMTRNMALFCDFENIALGVRDAKYDRFDLKVVLERLLLKGNIVLKKAYSDWDRYQDFKAALHEAAFELIEIPHIRQSGKNSADIRMVVDALDLCYTKAHVDTFVLLTGDSDFSPLVRKLRENNKYVIGVGVKNSTSDLLTGNCDEFIYYDDLARPKRKSPRRKKTTRSVTQKKKPASQDEASQDEKQQEALDRVMKTVEDLFEERGEEEKVWGSMVKQALKRRHPGFSERYHGFPTFARLLEEAETRGLLILELDEKSGGYIIRSHTSEE